MQKSLFLFLFSFLILISSLSAQEVNYAYGTFRETRIVNGHSTEMLERGILKFIISHRFGNIKSGVDQLFGIDQSTIRLGVDYAITNNLNVGVGRSSFQKTYDGYIKYKWLSQRSGSSNMPISLTVYLSSALNTSATLLVPSDLSFINRFSYISQVLLARKFSPRFSLQLMPTYVHRNYVTTDLISNDTFHLGIASKIQVSKVTAILLEYYQLIAGVRAVNRYNSLSIGIEFETLGHIFQVHLSNSTGMSESLFLLDTNEGWGDFSVKLGFNLTRDFRVLAKKFD